MHKIHWVLETNRRVPILVSPDDTLLVFCRHLDHHLKLHQDLAHAAFEELLPGGLPFLLGHLAPGAVQPLHLEVQPS